MNSSDQDSWEGRAAPILLSALEVGALINALSVARAELAPGEFQTMVAISEDEAGELMARLRNHLEGIRNTGG